MDRHANPSKHLPVGINSLFSLANCQALCDGLRLQEADAKMGLDKQRIHWGTCL